MKTVGQITKYLGLYFVSFVLLSFSISKFLNAQFQIWNYTEYTPLRELQNMELAWSFFSRSYNYNLFIGIMEFAAGTLILFNRTRLIGLLIALGIYMNIIIVDIEFDVTNALLHAVIEFVIVLLILIPYLKHVKKFFWDMGGKFNGSDTTKSNLVDRYLPFGFIAISSVTVVVLFNNAIASQDQIIGAYKISEFSINGENVESGRGKFTKSPILFFEFNNGYILSLRDSSFYGNYSLKNDSVFINLVQSFKNVKAMQGKMSKDERLINGVTDTGQPFELKIERVKRKE